MEKQIEVVLVNILHNMSQITKNNSILDKYYKLFDKRQYFGKEFICIYDDMKNEYGLEKYFFSYDNEMRVIYQKLVTALVNVKDTKHRLKLIPLVIYLDIDNILYEYLYVDGFFSEYFKIKDFFIGTIKDSDVQIDLSNTPKEHYEREMYNEYETGLKSYDFRKIYNFVDGINRGIGFEYNLFIDFLIFVSVREFYNDFLKVLDAKNNVLIIKNLLHKLSDALRLQIAVDSTNLLVSFEVIKDRVYFKKEKDLSEDEIKLLIQSMKYFTEKKTIWNSFLKFFLEYPSRNPQLFSPLAKLIEILNTEKQSLLIDKIKIDKYMQEESKKALNNCFLHIDNNTIQNQVLEKIFYRWKNFIDGCDDYFGAILTTDVIDIVIVYIQNYIDKNSLIEKINICINELEEIENRWFKDKSEQKNYFYKQITKLFVYSWGIYKFKLYKLLDKIYILCVHSYILKKEIVHEQKTTLKLFHEYIFKHQVYTSLYCNLTYLKDKNTILCKWLKKCSGEAYRTPLLYGLELLEVTNADTWMTDTTNGFESDPEDTQWLLEEFIPKAKESSCRRVVFIIENESPLKAEIDAQSEILSEYFEVLQMSSLEAIEKNS